MINFVKKVHNKLLALQQKDNDIMIWDLAQDGQLFQKLTATLGSLEFAWSSVSNHFIAVSSHCVRVYALDQDAIKGWKEISTVSINLQGQVKSINFAFPLAFIRVHRDSCVVNVLTGEKRIVPEVYHVDEPLHCQRLSHSGLFLMIEDASVVNSPNSIDSHNEANSTYAIYSLVPFITSDCISDVSDLTDMKKVEIDLRRVSSSRPTSWTWHPRISGTSYELLSVVFADFSVAVFSITHESTMEDDGIMAIALKAVMAARSMNNDPDAGGLFRLEEATSPSLTAVSLIPTVTLVTVLDGVSCSHLLNVSATEVQQAAQPLANSHHHFLTTSWLETTADPATMIEEDDDNTPLVSTSTKLALPPVVRKSKRVDLAHQGYWMALLCGHGSELRTVVMRLGYEVQVSAFQFDISSQIRARITYAHNGNMSVLWPQRMCHLEGFFSPNFRQMVAMESISYNTLQQTTTTNTSTVAVKFIQRLHVRNKASEFRKVMESNFFLNCISTIDVTPEVGYVRHMPNPEREGKLHRLPSVAVLGLQKRRSLPRMYLLPISNSSCRHLEDGVECTHHHGNRNHNNSNNSSSYNLLSNRRRNPHRRRYVLDESDFVLCAFDDFAPIIDVYIRDPAYLSGASQLSPRPKASTSSLEEIHRGRYGNNPNIYYVDIIPDEQYGLGLRLDEEKDCITGYIKVVINSFKPHPITNEPMAAELTCKIAIGDEVLGANTVSFVNKSQSYVIQTMKSILATNHGNILRLVMKRAEKFASPRPSSDAVNAFSFNNVGSSTHSVSSIGSDSNKTNSTEHHNGQAGNWLHSYLQLHGIHHPIRDFKSLSPLHTLYLHPLKAHVQLDLLSLISSSDTSSPSPASFMQVIDVNTIVILDEIGQNEVTVFVLVKVSENLDNSVNNQNRYELHVFQLRYQAGLGHYVILRTKAPYCLSTIKQQSNINDNKAPPTSSTSFVGKSKDAKRLPTDISMVAHLLHAPDTNDLSFSVTIYHPTPLSMSTNAPPLQTIIEGRVQRKDEVALSTNHIDLMNIVEICRSPIQHFLETFRIDQSVYSRCLEQYARLQGQEMRRQAIEEEEANRFDNLSSNNPAGEEPVALNEELVRRKKQWSFLDEPVSVDVFLSTSRFFTIAREVNKSIEESLVDIVSILLQLQGHNVLYNIEALDRQWTERNSNDAGQILQILQKRNYIGRFQDYVRSKLKPYVDFRAKEFVAEYVKHRNDMFSSLAWQSKCDNSPWLYLGEQQATCSALFVIDHLAEVLKFASQVYVQGHSNSGFVKFLNASEALTSQAPQQRDDWRLLSTLLVQGQGYLQLDGYGMNSILYAMTKRGYTSVFLHMARKLESHKPEIFLRGRRKKAMEALDDGADDYKRTLAALAMDGNQQNNNGSNNSGGAGAFGIGTSALYEEKKQQRELEALRLAQAQYIPMYVSMTSVINALFSKSQEALFVIFVDNFNVLGKEDDASRLQMWLSLGKDVSYTRVSNDVPADAEPVPVWQHVDLLTYATRMKVSLWLHDLEPLIQLILRHALKQFKTNKSAMEVFLDLVIIGKTETLLQLAKTDPSPSGKQLLSLLLQVDEAFNPSNSSSRKKRAPSSEDDEEDSSDEEEEEEEDDEATRVANVIAKLRKNADALVRKKRYREAAAVLLLLPTAQMLKSALNLLTFQFNAPFLAHLVARCIEYRIYCHGELSAQKLERNILREMMRSNYDAVYSRVGCVHGIYSTTLIERDILPDLWRTMDFAKRSQQSTTFNQVQEQERRNSAYYHLEGIPCLQTTMVVALWTQKMSLIRETFHKVMDYLEENLTFHPESIGDFSRKIVLPSRSTDNANNASTYNIPAATAAATAAASAANANLGGNNNNMMGGIWTGKLGIPPMLMHEIHVGLTKSCVHDFSADDILIIQNFLRVTYGQDIYRVYGFIEVFLSLGVFEAYAEIAGKDAMHRIATFTTKLYSILGMEEEALRFQAHRGNNLHANKKRTVKINAFLSFCEKFRATAPTNFHNIFEQLNNEVSLMKQQARQREKDLLASLAAAHKLEQETKDKQQQQQQQEENAAPKLSFNFASKPSSSSGASRPLSTTRNMLDDFDSPTLTPSSNRVNATGNFSFASSSASPPPSSGPLVSSSSVSKKPAAAAAGNNNTNTKAGVRKMLDDFDAPPPRVPRKQPPPSAAGGVPSALDMFDYVPRNAASNRTNNSHSTSDNNNSNPVAPKKPTTGEDIDPFAAASKNGTSALDMFDMPPVSRPAPRRATDNNNNNNNNNHNEATNVKKDTTASVDPFQSAGHKSALDMFDMPPPRPRANNRASVSTTSSNDKDVPVKKEVPPPDTTTTTTATPPPVASTSTGATPPSTVPPPMMETPIAPTPQLSNKPSTTPVAVKSALDFDVPMARPKRPAPAPGPANPVPVNVPAAGSTAVNTTAGVSTASHPTSMGNTGATSTTTTTTNNAATTMTAGQQKKVPPPNPFSSGNTNNGVAATSTASSAPQKTSSSATSGKTPGVVVNPFSTSMSTSSTSVNSSVSIEDKVCDFYRQHNPSKLASVPEILAKYQGKEAELLQKLQKQYGVSSNP